MKNFRPKAVAAADDFEFVIINNASNRQGNLDAQEVLSISWPTPMTAFSTGGSPPYNPDLATPTDTNEPYLTFLNYVLGQSDLPYVISSSYGRRYFWP